MQTVEILQIKTLLLKSAGLEGKQSKNYNTCGLVLRFSGVWKLTIHKLVVFSILIGTELENSITKLHSNYEEEHNLKKKFYLSNILSIKLTLSNAN